jgi:UDP:flavonoid glycosyltransferase YjiC (YdhE family)
VVPFGGDQPDNGARVERLGAGLCLSRNIYSAKTAATVLNRLLTDLRFGERTAEVEARLRQEGGLTLACDAIESVLERATVKLTLQRHP